MPGLNGTGPLGKGPRTGRAIGKCEPGKDEVSEAPFGRGLGRGGWGRGLGRGAGRRRRGRG
ncbi:DUF5320 domain-containing protein [Prolixibacter denitrificans]|uniref:Uncharacterized protein n=1 Tax=Prolixibacter denitrificans TaxID=1541063 RepID=A0A2P8C5X6_9BACT|nr:DUF5320 domain-containing protein [Prolixibacter denitrificans]PSK80366.1 hypothetical protein CLV93_11710 [Prolixibacter denitrificans]GET23075.1 hypothetical protein JCM18694_33210 [Prolixibacter denitrificans]